MVVFDYDLDLIDIPVEVTPHSVPMTKLHYEVNGAWETKHVPNNQIERQLRAWDEEGIDYALLA